MSPGRDEKQTNIDAALPACGKILGPLGDTGPQRARLFFESPTQAGVQFRPFPWTRHPAEMAEPDINAFLTHLALLFFYPQSRNRKASHPPYRLPLLRDIHFPEKKAFAVQRRHSDDPGWCASYADPYKML